MLIKSEQLLSMKHWSFFSWIFFSAVPYPSRRRQQTFDDDDEDDDDDDDDEKYCTTILV
jgi:hypothetical protein